MDQNGVSIITLPLIYCRQYFRRDLVFDHSSRSLIQEPEITNHIQKKGNVLSLFEIPYKNILPIHKYHHAVECNNETTADSLDLTVFPVIPHKLRVFEFKSKVGGRNRTSLAS
jgi:hypothetical protein